jgi:hypothetical protein
MMQLLLACAAVLTAPAMHNTQNDDAVTGFLAKVSAISRDYAGTVSQFGPAQAATKTVRQADIPAKVLAGTLEWVQKTLREPYATDLARATWTGFPNTGHRDEPLSASVGYDNGSLTWSDTGTSIILLINTGSQTVPADEQARQRWIFDALPRYLRLRVFPTEQIKYSIRNRPESASVLWAGYISRGRVKMPNGDYVSPLGWDCSLHVATDGRFLLVRMNACDDDTTGLGHAINSWDKPPKKSRFDK